MMEWKVKKGRKEQLKLIPLLPSFQHGPVIHHCFAEEFLTVLKNVF